MTIDEQLVCWQKQGYQSYWIMFCLYNNYSNERVNVYKPREIFTKYSSWISSKHNEFEPDEQKRRSADYPVRFIDWLKEGLKVKQGEKK